MLNANSHRVNLIVNPRESIDICNVFTEDVKTEHEEPTATEEEQEEKEEVEFTEIEANIRDSIIDNEPLTNETLDSIIPAWWKEEPFR